MERRGEQLERTLFDDSNRIRLVVGLTGDMRRRRMLFLAMIKFAVDVHRCTSVLPIGIRALVGVVGINEVGNTHTFR